MHVQQARADHELHSLPLAQVLCNAERSTLLLQPDDPTCQEVLHSCSACVWVLAMVEIQ